MKWMLVLAMCWAGAAMADVSLTPSPTTSFGKTWEAWKAKLPSWTDYTPGGQLIKNMGRAEDNVAILWQKGKNLRAYDRYCGHGAPFTQQPFCMAVRPSLRARPTDWLAQSPLRILLNSLIDRAGPNTSAGHDAATLLYTLRTLLEYPKDEPSHPDRMVGLLYQHFANCIPNTCQVAITRPEGFQTAMRGLLAYFQTYGGDIDIQAVSLLRKAGF